MEKTYFAHYHLSHGIFTISQEGEHIVSIIPDDGENTFPDSPSLLTDAMAKELEEYFLGVRRRFETPFRFRGTSFQLLVWKALLNIPYGETRTYGDIANRIGKPKAARAVGMASHRNPLAIVVPCHRVLGANGKLTGYRYGLDLKEVLLTLEKENCSVMGWKDREGDHHVERDSKPII